MQQHQYALGGVDEELVDIVPPPTHPEDGRPLTRYIAWVQFKRYLDCEVEDVRRELPDDEVGLVSVEGFHIHHQLWCSMSPFKHNIGLLGSCSNRRTDGKERILIVGPHDHVDPANPCNSFWSIPSSRLPNRMLSLGFASRGVKVVPVTWEKAA